MKSFAGDCRDDNDQGYYHRQDSYAYAGFSLAQCLEICKETKGCTAAWYHMQGIYCYLIWGGPFTRGSYRTDGLGTLGYACYPLYEGITIFISKYFVLS